MGFTKEAGRALAIAGPLAAEMTAREGVAWRAVPPDNDTFGRVHLVRTSDALTVALSTDRGRSGRWEAGRLMLAVVVPGGPDRQFLTDEMLYTWQEREADKVPPRDGTTSMAGRAEAQARRLSQLLPGFADLSSRARAYNRRVHAEHQARLDAGEALCTYLGAGEVRPDYGRGDEIQVGGSVCVRFRGGRTRVEVIDGATFRFYGEFTVDQAATIEIIESLRRYEGRQRAKEAHLESRKVGGVPV